MVQTRVAPDVVIEAADTLRMAGVPGPCDIRLKLADTDLPEFNVNAHVFPDVVAPQPDHVVPYPEVGAAVSVTDVPEVNVAEQLDPQLTPEGEDVMLPLPDLVTVRVGSTAG